MTTTDINDVATIMTRLQTNYTNLISSWYNIFYNTSPQDVNLELYDTAGTLTTYTIPNRAKDFTHIKNGNGIPESVVTGSVGEIYQDLTNGELYIKESGTGNTGWVSIAKTTDIETDYLNKGAGTPEGNIIASIGAVYIDTSNGDLYIKRTSSGNTGWYLNAGIETKTSIQTKLEVSAENITALSNLTGINSGNETAQTISSALGYTPSNDSLVVHLTGDENIAGTKNFTALTNMTSISIGELGYTAANPLISTQCYVDSFGQIILRNSSSSASSSSDIVVNNNLSTDTTYYGDFGMNSSGWSGSGSFNSANMVYLTSTSADLAIGTTTSNAIHFVVNGDTTDAMTISSTKDIIANSTITSTQFKLSALNTAPASASATGTLGEVRFTSSAVYLCVATNTWKKVALATW